MLQISICRYLGVPAYKRYRNICIKYVHVNVNL